MADFKTQSFRGLDSKIVASIFNFDFSATKDIGFVHTIGGVHTDNAANVAPGTTAGAANSTEAWQRTGYCGLGRAVKKLGLDTDREIKVDYVTSSVGSLNGKCLRSPSFPFSLISLASAKTEAKFLEYNHGFPTSDYV